MCVLLAIHREQQQSKPSSPLSKWHKHSSGGRSGNNSSMAAAAVAALGANAGGSTAAAAGGGTLAAGGGGGGGSSVFSPMTSQLPAVRAGSLNTHAAATAAGAGDPAGHVSVKRLCKRCGVSCCGSQRSTATTAAMHWQRIRLPTWMGRALAGNTCQTAAAGAAEKRHSSCTILPCKS